MTQEERDLLEQKAIKDVKKILKKNGIKINKIVNNLIDRYAFLYAFMIYMEQELKGTTLMYEYTNKAGATNMTKNPLVSEYKMYVKEFSNLSKTLINLGNIETSDNKKDDFLDY